MLLKGSLKLVYGFLLSRDDELMPDLRRDDTLAVSLGRMRATLFLEFEGSGTAFDGETYLSSSRMSLSRL
jgi:hypothetical protein